MAGTALKPITGADVACASADAGPLEVEINATMVQPMKACADWCKNIELCVVKSQDPTKPIEVVGWVETVDGVFVSHAGVPPFKYELGACSITGSETINVWELGEDGCRKFVESVEVTIFGPKRLVPGDGGWVPVDEKYLAPLELWPECVSWGPDCVPVIVDPADSYDAYSLSGVEVTADPDLDDYNCATGTWAAPTTVTVGDKTVTVTPGHPFVWPPDGGCGCGSRIADPISIDGPHVMRAWTCEERENC